MVFYQERLTIVKFSASTEFSLSFFTFNCVNYINSLILIITNSILYFKNKFPSEINVKSKNKQLNNNLNSIIKTRILAPANWAERRLKQVLSRSFALIQWLIYFVIDGAALFRALTASSTWDTSRFILRVKIFQLNNCVNRLLNELLFILTDRKAWLNTALSPFNKPLLLPNV